MKFVKNYRCTLCGREYSKNEKLYTCPECGEKGILDVEYDYDGLKNILSQSYFDNNRNYSMWRYKDIISVEDEYLDETLRVGWTPLYKSKSLADKIGLKELYIKDEGLNPTASLKDRASAVAVIKAKEEEKKTIACSSTGNAASSLAGNAARLGISTVIFVPERAPQGKLAQLLIYGAKVISVKGDYKETFELSKKAIDHWGWYNRNAAINPHLVEGKKTVAMEIAEQLRWHVPDWVVVSVGDGCTIGGVYKGFYDLFQIGLIERIPRILGVQAEGCCPFYTSYKENEPLRPAKENTIADSISVGVPRNPVKAMNAVSKSGGSWITISDTAILEAMKLLGSTEGIFGEPAGVAGLAGLIKALNENVISNDESVSIIVTGNGLKDVKNALAAVEAPIICNPDINQLKKYLSGLQ
ncbi:threonine synthase [Vallitalea longa]|uniref:Threonine synthase n=1 Tax=Vallitalea longa TaxID=2936439 RepID=A0A9W5YC99_9FIRM|nr:threonine synthase [Vallitalea longa]GKX30021.1 threonine synthase [Vallitalea longa]